MRGVRTPRRSFLSQVWSRYLGEIEAEAQHTPSVPFSNVLLLVTILSLGAWWSSIDIRIEGGSEKEKEVMSTHDSLTYDFDNIMIFTDGSGIKIISLKS